MKLINKLPFRWIFRIAVIILASFITGLSFGWCFLAYIGIMFLAESAKNMIVIILGIVLVIAATLATFLGLIAL